MPVKKFVLKNQIEMLATKIRYFVNKNNLAKISSCGQNLNFPQTVRFGSQNFDF